MSGVSFLLDENVPFILQAFLGQRAPEMGVYAVGEEPAPPKGTPDPDILAWIEAHGCMLITNNRATMPMHLQAHLGQGRHVPGIVQLPRQVNISAIVDDLLLIGGAALSAEFQDQMIYLPLRG